MRILLAGHDQEGMLRRAGVFRCRALALGMLPLVFRFGADELTGFVFLVVVYRRPSASGSRGGPGRCSLPRPGLDATDSFVQQGRHHQKLTRNTHQKLD